MFAFVAVGVLALRRGPFGRRLAAMRDSQAACATLGLDVRRTKLAVFALSSAIAGLAGALYGGLGFTAGQLDFEPLYNVLLFLFAVRRRASPPSPARSSAGSSSLPSPWCSRRRPSSPAWSSRPSPSPPSPSGKQPNGMAGLLYSFARQAGAVARCEAP